MALGAQAPEGTAGGQHAPKAARRLSVSVTVKKMDPWQTCLTLLASACVEIQRSGGGVQGTQWRF
jgi:hypothetical protein